LFFVLERADDGTWVAAPEYAGEDDERAHCCGSHSLRPGKVTADAKAHAIMLMKWDLAATIIDFKNDIRELIHDYFNPSVDRQVQLLKLHDLLHEPGDLRAREMLLLLYAALDEDRVLADTFEAAVLRDTTFHHAPVVEEEDKETHYPAKPMSVAGFVNREFMRMCIKAFFYPGIDVHNETKDTHGTS
jgi:hypothetical protein